MEKSQTISELAKALVKFQSKMGVVAFDSDNPFFKSKYASLSTIVSTSKPILAECGLAISQLAEAEGGVTTILMHVSGEYLSATLTLKAVKDDPQAHGSAITYARRYAYASILGIVSDEDDDGNGAIKPTQATKPSFITEKELHQLRDLLIVKERSESKLCEMFKIEKLEQLPKEKFISALSAINAPKASEIKK